MPEKHVSEKIHSSKNDGLRAHERYTSKDCLPILNPSFDARFSQDSQDVTSDTLYSFKSYLDINLVYKPNKACHVHPGDD